MNHKRKRPKHQRAGCLWCKPQKDERGGKEPRDPPAARRRMLGREDIRLERDEFLCNGKGPWPFMCCAECGW